MRCREAKQWLAARRDGDLTQAETDTLQQHLQEC